MSAALALTLVDAAVADVFVVTEILHLAYVQTGTM